MITNNYIKAVIANILGAGTTVAIKDVTGAERSLEYISTTDDAFGSYGDDITPTIDTEEARGVGFVYGGTEPTPEDYKSDGTLITGLTVSSARQNIVDEAGFATKFNYTITNNNSYDVTIDEVCWIAAVFYASGKAYRVLADRTKLESPITIPAGGVGQVTYTIRMNYPTA